MFCGCPIHVFFRHAVVLLDGLINPGFPEVSGNVICPGEELYKTVTAARIEQHMLAHIRIDLAQFKLITDRCLAPELARAGG